ncbi:hypothetical protein BDQ17DRAFT_742995 [Cyathus striatus]|nr:hypothetical protein BDQ17DRAFT_742995 [Cyathus striatus]
MMKLKTTLSTLILSKISWAPIPWTVILTDLPAEVLYTILERLDPASLHRLALTCRYLHVLSLPVLYKRYLQPDISQRISINGVTYPILPALRLALFMRRVERVEWTLDFRRRRTFSELAQLSRFLSHTTSTGSIHIDFGTTRKVLGWRVRGETISVWRMLIIRLLEIAACKSGAIFIRDNLDIAKQHPKLCGLVPKFWIPYPETGGRFNPTFLVLLKRLPRLVASVPRVVSAQCLEPAITSSNTIVEKSDRVPTDVDAGENAHDISSSTTWFNSLYTGYSTSPRPNLVPMREEPAIPATQHTAFDDAPEYEFIDSDTPLEAEYEFLDKPPNRSKPQSSEAVVLPQVKKGPKFTVNHLTLDSLSLVQEPFLPWTLDFMNRTSLTTLDLCVNQTTVDFFVNVHVPTLEEFTYSSGVVDLDDLVWFLQRHPALEVVRFRHTRIVRNSVVAVRVKQKASTPERHVRPSSNTNGGGSPYPCDAQYGDRIQHLEAPSKISNHLREAGFKFSNLKSLTLELTDFDGYHRAKTTSSQLPSHRVK